MADKYKQPKSAPKDNDWPPDEEGFYGVKSFGRRPDQTASHLGKKSYGTAKGGGAATKGKKFLKD